MVLRQTLSTGTSESSIVFYNGGHNHDGISSALIDVSKYSLYDFTTDFLGTTARQETQAFNYGKFKEVVARIVKEDVLTIAGIKLLPNEVKAENITAGAITADKLSANIVLVNNKISSNNFDGTIAANGIITSDGTAGWAITSAGDAVFSNTSIRGTITAGALYINDYNLWTSNGVVIMGDPSSNTASFVFDPDVGLAVEGSVTATSGKIASFSILGSTLNTGGEFLGEISIGPETTGYGNAAAGAMIIQTRDYDNTLATSIVRGQDITVYDPDSGQHSVLSKYGLETSGGVVYPYTADQIGFYWDGTDIYAVINDTIQICLTQCGTGTITVSPTVSGVNPAVSPGDCPTCYDLGPCCPPATCGTDAKLGNYCL